MRAVHLHTQPERSLSVAMALDGFDAGSARRAALTADNSQLHDPLESGQQLCLVKYKL